MEILVGIIVAIIITIVLKLRDSRIQLELAVEMLEAISAMFMSGVITEGDYIERKAQIIDGFSSYQKRLYNKMKDVK